MGAGQVPVLPCRKRRTCLQIGFRMSAASATAAHLTAHIGPRSLAGGGPSLSLTTLALAHGYTRAFWWGVGIFTLGAVVAAVLFRWGPLPSQGQPVPSGAARTQAQGAPEPGVILG